MTAATEDRRTPSRAAREHVFTVASGKTVFAGTIVCVNASGAAEPGSVSQTLTAAGIALAAAGAGEQVRAARGCYLLANDVGNDPVTDADWGKACYIVDDQTVSISDGTATRSVAGIVRGVESAGVWVEF